MHGIAIENMLTCALLRNYMLYKLLMNHDDTQENIKKESIMGNHCFKTAVSFYR